MGEAVRTSHVSAAMSVLASRPVALAACASAVGALGYSVYFDRCRVNHPDYLNKLKIRRRDERLAREEEAKKAAAAMGGPSNGAPAGAVSAEKYFVQEIELGDAFLRKGDEVNAVLHFANAISIHANHQEMLEAMQPHMPASTFERLVRKLTEMKRQRLSDKK